jgi:pimeloyl-ACP methyl ester carboxylesterase
MATYVLIRGAGDSAFYWHLLAPELRELGHDVVAPDLPCEDDSAGLAKYADTVVEAIGDRTNLIVVAQSFGGFTAPLVCSRVPVELIVLVAGMIPLPGEKGDDWPANTGMDKAGEEPWPLNSWPDVPTRYLLCRDDRFFPVEWMRGVVRERLGMTPDEIEGGHCPALGRPKELAERLESYRAEFESSDSLIG